MSERSPDAYEVTEPCPACGSLWALDIEINDDNPEAMEHHYSVCADCWETR